MVLFYTNIFGGVTIVDASIAAVVGIIVVVVALNFYFMLIRMRRGNNNRKRMDRTAVDEAKQALRRDREISRRLEQENDDAVERIKLREETLAFYEEVRRRYADEDVRKEYMALRREVLGEEEANNPTAGLHDESVDLDIDDTDRR